MLKICYNKIVDRLLTKITINNKNYDGIWDTGATICVIDNKIAKYLDLDILKEVFCSTPMGIYKTNIYEIDLEINDLLFQNVKVLGGDLDEKEFLIGMNIINQGKFILENKKETILSFSKY